MKKQVTKEQLDAAEKARDAARRNYNDLNSLYIARVAEPQMRQNVGKCFRCRNTYSGGKCWWLYTKIVGVKSGEYLTVQIQKTSLGHIEISQQRQSFYWRANDAMAKRPLGASYAPIKPSVFNRSAREILADAARLVAGERI